MIKIFPFLIFFSGFQMQAQVYNGSFEDSNGIPDPTGGWMMPFCDIQVAPSTDTPGGTGNWSLQVLAEDPDISTCYLTYDLYQSVSWLSPGPSTLSYWYKGHGGEGPPARVMVAYHFEGSSAPALTSGWNGGNTTTEWIYMEETFFWDGITPPADSLIVLLAGGAALNGPLYSYFDDIMITGFSTGIRSKTDRSTAFRPNPASSDLWIDLNEVPVSIEAMDMLGRSMEMEPASFTQHTLRLDVSALPAGPVVLRLQMKDALRIVRFMKI
ncbi:MAG: T9SS type A sorting domain-containing protein [Bacteroidota bacterium]|nr:T9SS type A sorting domain-containing protein [Bacteroidota bacterium]